MQDIHSVVVYIRTSTAAQLLSIAAQERACRAYASDAGWFVAAVFADKGVSGRTPVLKRSGLVAALDSVQAHTDRGLLVYSLSRLSRKAVDLLSVVNQTDARVFSAVEGIDTTTTAGLARVRVLAGFAEWESEVISTRTRAALAELQHNGVKLGAPPMSADVRQRVCDVAATMPGATPRAVAAALNAAGVRPARGRTWHPRSVERALGDPAVIAAVRAMTVRHPGLGPRGLASRLNEAGVKSVTGKRWHAVTVRTALRLV